MKERCLGKLFVACLVVAAVHLLAATPGHAVKPGRVLKSTTSNTVYLVTETGAIAGIPSPEVYNCLKLTEKENYRVGQDKIDGMKKTQLLIRRNSGPIYLVEGKQKRQISSPAVFKNKGYDSADVFTLSDDKLNCLADGAPIK